MNKSPVIEAVLTIVRKTIFGIVSFVVTFGVSKFLQAFGIDGKISPEQFAIVVGILTIVLDAIDKFAHEYNKQVPASQQIGLSSKGLSPV